MEPLLVAHEGDMATQVIGHTRSPAGDAQAADLTGGIDHDHRGPGAGGGECGTEAGRPGPDDNHIWHGRTVSVSQRYVNVPADGHHHAGRPSRLMRVRLGYARER